MIRSAVLIAVASILLSILSIVFGTPGSTIEPPSIPDAADVSPRDELRAPALRGGFDLVILNGRVMDPESGFDRHANVGIMGDTIVTITDDPLSGRQTVDATGLVVAPGFIDVTMPGFPSQELYLNIQHWKLADGVTTALWTHDGWHDPREVIQPIRDRLHLINWGVGTSINRLHLRADTHNERLALLEDAVRAGGISVGASPEYFQFITTEALVDFARIADEHGLWLGLHLRYSRRDTELEGVREAIAIAEQSGAHIHIFHISSTGATYNAAEALRLLDEARHRGIRITADVYPYSFWMTYLNSARFADGWQEGFDLDYDDLFHVPTREHLTADTFRELRSANGLTVVPEDTISWDEAILPALSRDWIFIASDGWSGRNPFRGDTPFAGHPRGSGTFATALSLHRTHELSLMTLLQKITLDPAVHMEVADESFTRRGRLQIGAYADITVFDPERVGGAGTVLDSARASEGIHTVIVNGTVAFENDTVLGRDAGRLLNRGR